MTNKEMVVKAMKEFFVDREHNAIERYWHEMYVQHNPSMINGHQGLRVERSYRIDSDSCGRS